MRLKLVLSTVLSAFILGCGGGGSSSTSSTTTTTNTINGVVVDGPIAFARVCLDRDGDGDCTGEIIVTADKEGKFSISYEGTLEPVAQLIAFDGIDIERNVNFDLNYTVPANIVDTLTPITNMIYTYAKEYNLTFDEVANDIAYALKLTYTDVISNPEYNDEVKIIATTLQSAVEILLDLEPDAKYKELLIDFVDGFKETSSIEDIKAKFDVILDKLQVSDEAKEAAKVLVDALIDVLKEKDEEALLKYSFVKELVVEGIQKLQDDPELKAKIIDELEDLIDENLNIDLLNTIKTKVNEALITISEAFADFTPSAASVSTFASHKLILEKDDTIYFTSDGKYYAVGEGTYKVVDNVLVLIDSNNNIVKLMAFNFDEGTYIAVYPYDKKVVKGSMELVEFNEDEFDPYPTYKNNDETHILEVDDDFLYVNDDGYVEFSFLNSNNTGIRCITKYRSLDDFKDDFSNDELVLDARKGEIDCKYVENGDDKDSIIQTEVIKFIDNNDGTFQVHLTDGEFRGNDFDITAVDDDLLTIKD